MHLRPSLLALIAMATLVACGDGVDLLIDDGPAPTLSDGQTQPDGQLQDSESLDTVETTDGGAEAGEDDALESDVAEDAEATDLDEDPEDTGSNADASDAEPADTEPDSVADTHIADDADDADDADVPEDADDADALPDVATDDVVPDDANADSEACRSDDECVPAGSCERTRCRDGVCEREPNLGQTCDDGDPCTQDDACDRSGACVGTLLTCDEVRACIQPVCNPATGACDVVAENDTPCDDGDVCTRNGRCEGGECVSSSACEGPCLTGLCEATEGDVYCEPVSALTSCTVANTGDEGACSAGVCVPVSCDGSGAPVPCDADGDCEARCGDGDLCSGTWRCADGVCMLPVESVVVCPELASPCQRSVCDPTSGVCETISVADGTTCDDGLTCTVDDTCSEGRCGGTAIDCSGSSGPCMLGVCDPTTGTCGVPVADGHSCADGDVCNGTELCAAGACVEGEPLDCPSGVCEVATCDSVVGCGVVAALDGTLCGSDDECAGVERCAAGACERAMPLDCGLSTACMSYECMSGIGCVATAAPDGTSCADGDRCNGDETCLEGECLPGPDADCETFDPCAIGFCDPAIGCTQIALPDGTDCGDGDVCNGDEVCAGGSCSAGSPIVCEPSECRSAFCDSASGCVTEDLANGTPCDDGDAFTSNDACASGRCVGGAPVVMSFLPDTGQDSCWDTDGNARSCTPSAGGLPGEDGGLLTNPMRLTTVSPGVVQDEVTGLRWTASAESSLLTQSAAEDACRGLAIGGETDWRLPTIRELSTVLDYGVAASASGGMWTSPLSGPRGWYWTVDSDPSNALRGIRVSSRYGTSGSQERTIADGYARCVAGESAAVGSPSWSIDSEVGVYVSGTGLFWQRVPSNNLTWEGALTYCDGLRSQGYGGFRLPDIKELASLIDTSFAYPAADPALFPGLRVGQRFWSSTTANDVYREDAYTVGLGDTGTIGVERKTLFRQALCVRSCPCPDPACCSACLPLVNGQSCDDEDATTVRDSCGADGQCAGVPFGTPELPPAAPFDCNTGLDCGAFGTCLRDALTGNESCLCATGLSGPACDVPATVERSSVCRPADFGHGPVCLTDLESAAGRLEPSGEEMSAPPPEAESRRARVILPASTFRVHNQQDTNTCVPNAVGAALELRMGTASVPLSESSLIARVVGAREDHIALRVCSGNYSPFRDDTVAFAERLVSGDRAIIAETTPIGDSELNYPELSCTEGTGNVRLPPDEPATVEPQSVQRLPDAAAARASLDAGRAVVVAVPIWFDGEGGDDGHAWSSWINGASSESEPWRVISSESMRAARGSDLAAPCQTPLIGSALRCNDGRGECSRGICMIGSHAVTLVGYETGVGEDMFYFVNSWGENFGRALDDFGGGIGKMSFEFVDEYATGIVDIVEIDYPCRANCDIGSHRCSDSRTAYRCDVVDQLGCTAFATPVFCDRGYECDDGPAACIPSVGDGICTSDENCTTSPDDCRCGAGELCDPAAAGRGCVDSPEHACAPGETGCFADSERASWYCGLAPDGDNLRDRIRESCEPSEICDAGACVLECQPSYQRVCHPSENAVWMADSCGSLEFEVRACTAGEECAGGHCAPCSQPDITVCHNGDEWLADGCTETPTRRVRECGIPEYGSPYCDGTARYAIVDEIDRGCRAGRCYAERQENRTHCSGGTCSSGTCGASCGDGLCAPGEEDCNSCPGDCPCWGSTLSQCSERGCVQCIQDSDCYTGSSCEDNVCVIGCDECGPIGSERCGADGDREVCQRVFNCNRWISSPCGWESTCCQGTCSQTSPLAAPTPVLPADGAEVSSSRVRFQWENPPGGNRVRIVLCRDRGLTDCVAVWEPRAGYYYYEVTAPAGDWWWSVSATSPCDAAPWGAAAQARRVRVR